ncbi:hypothetical protein XELAEV_18032100mg [Xenopus laevis]|uniref:Uncharacterized protein n=1 Tax=Xenopus laevis TaxID=8355 RepID=A0A974CQH2_XENLA|nr:hypothetical protein XELAEV_18032100mg [Xenopus laevis]
MGTSLHPPHLKNIFLTKPKDEQSMLKRDKIHDCPCGEHPPAPKAKALHAQHFPIPGALYKCWSDLQDFGVPTPLTMHQSIPMCFFGGPMGIFSIYVTGYKAMCKL